MGVSFHFGPGLYPAAKGFNREESGQQPSPLMIRMIHLGMAF